MPRVVLYGEVGHHYLGLYNLYTTTCLLKIQTVLDNKWKDSITNKLICISMESFNIELGIQGSIFKLDYETLRHLGTDCWIKHLWKFAHENSIKVGDVVKGRELIREIDSMLSDKFTITVRLKIIDKGDWDVSNRCTLSLKVLLAADIETGDVIVVDINFYEVENQRGDQEICDKNKVHQC